MVRIPSNKSKRCCCGCCKQRTGSIVILWILLILSLSSIFQYAAIKNEGLYGFSIFASNVMEVILIAVALSSISHNEPQYTVPYIGFSVLQIAACVVMLTLLLVSPSKILNSGIVEYVLTVAYSTDKLCRKYNISVFNDDLIPEEIKSDKDLEELSNSLIMSVTTLLTIIIGVHLLVKFYTTNVLYNYYKEMVNEIQEIERKKIAYEPRQRHVSVNAGSSIDVNKSKAPPSSPPPPPTSIDVDNSKTSPPPPPIPPTMPSTSYGINSLNDQNV